MWLVSLQEEEKDSQWENKGMTEEENGVIEDTSQETPRVQGHHQKPGRDKEAFFPGSEGEYPHFVSAAPGN